jgi:hypothetical protein
MAYIQDDYRRWLDKIEQDMKDREELALIARCKALPATEEEINDFRLACMRKAEEEGKSIEAAHIWADEFLKRCLDLNVLGPGMDAKNDEGT